jgi:GT2 family glycosyltransferase
VADGPAASTPPAPRPRVSVVIVTYNQGPYIEPCLRSLDQSNHERFILEATIVDNGSADDTVARLRALPYPWLRIIENGRNAGFAAASNVGIRATDGDYVLLLNPDTELPKTTLDAMVAFLEAHPRAAVVTPRLELEDGRIDPACHRGFPTPWVSLTYLSGLSRLFPHSRRFSRYHLGYLPLDEAHEIDAPSGAFMLIRRSVIAAIGDLDERFFMYTEEVDFCLRAKKAGYSIWYDPSETVLHVKGTATGIKKHSADIATANLATRLLCLNAFYDSTRKFYDKNYAAANPRVVGWAVHGIVEIARPIAVWRLKRRFRAARKTRTAARP